LEDQLQTAEQKLENAESIDARLNDLQMKLLEKDAMIRDLKKQ